MAEIEKERSSSNPALKSSVFAKLERREGDGVMTVAGAVNKTGILAMILACVAVYTGLQVLQDPESPWLAALIPALIVNLVLSLVIIFVKRSAPYLAPLYALIEGVLIGALSGMMEKAYPGIAMQAAWLTFGTLASMLLIYRLGIIRATQRFQIGLLAATGGIAIVYLIDMGLGFFGHQVPYLHDSSPLGIAISLGITVVAALNLILDFNFIERGAEEEAPKFMEWYAAFGLILTLVWLYLEILRLLSKLRKK